MKKLHSCDEIPVTVAVVTSCLDQGTSLLKFSIVRTSSVFTCGEAQQVKERGVSFSSSVQKESQTVPYRYNCHGSNGNRTYKANLRSQFGPKGVDQGHEGVQQVQGIRGDRQKRTENDITRQN